MFASTCNPFMTAENHMTLPTRIYKLRAPVHEITVFVLQLQYLQTPANISHFTPN